MKVDFLTLVFFLFVCSSYGIKPSQKDLLDHLPLIGEAAKRDAVLAKSKVRISFFNDIVVFND